MKVFDIAFKDLIRSTRNLFLIGMTVVAPLVITGLIYFAFGSLSGGDVSLSAIRVGIVDNDRLPASAPLDVPVGTNIRDIFFDDSVKSWITASDYPDETAARAAIDHQEIGVAVIIPPNFTEDYLAGQTGEPITLLQDPTLTIAPNVVRDMVTSLLDGVAGGGIAFHTINARLEASGTALDPAQIPALLARYTNWYADFQRALFHTPQNAALVMTSPAVSGESTDSLQAMMGQVMAGQLIFFSFFTSAYAMMSILQEDEEGTLARLFTTPTQRSVILSGKFLAVFLTVIFQGLVLMVIARFAFGVNWGEPASAALGLLGQMFASVGLGVLLISFVKTSKQAGPILGGALTGLGMLSGLFTTNINMPAAFNAMGNFTPQGWVLKAWRIALAGQSPSEMLLPFVVLVMMGGVMFAIGAAVFRRRYA
jgi:ABC-2 type transport system permease protein